MPSARLLALPRRFGTLIAALALAVPLAGGIVATTPAPAHADVSPTVNPTPAATAIAFALAQLGKPYSWGATGPGSYDCSGLTQAAYRSAGVTIPRVARYQYAALPKVARIYWRPGDLIFYAWNTSDRWTIHHVAIYLGAGWMLDSPHTGTVVQIRPMYYRGLMRYAVRPGGLNAAKLLNVAPDTTGDAVRDLQTRLRANGYDVAVTGLYDETTAAAVSDVRATYGLADSSTVGWLLWHELVVNGTHLHPAA
jgi:NlpC/P60 family/Putative peptidoglycan binding domain